MVKVYDVNKIPLYAIEKIMDSKQKWWLFISTTMAWASFLGLYYFWNNVCPSWNTSVTTSQGERICLAQETPQILSLLFLLIFMFLGTSAGTIPFAMYLNYRFAKADWFEKDKFRLARQGAWVGLWCVSTAYLQLMRSFNWAIALALIGIFVLLEIFLLTRE